MYYIYILRCNDNSLYTGYTNNTEKREEAHNTGKGSAYTRSRLPVKLVYSEEFKNRDEAMRREWKIKQMSRKEKEKLIKQILIT